MAVETTGHEKCIKQFVLNVGENVKFHSSPQKVGQFIAGNAIRRGEEDINSLNKNGAAF